MGPDTQNGPCLQQCMDRFAREVNAAFKRTRLLRSVIRLRGLLTRSPYECWMVVLHNRIR